MMKPKAPSVILLSGGLDSAANLALCAERDQPLLAITADYGQRSAVREIRAAGELCRYYNVDHKVISLSWLGEVGGSALTDSAQGIPDLKTVELDNRELALETAKAVWVPNRNGVLINAAAAFAEKLGAKRVVVGFNIEEAATFPDNTHEFMKAASVSLAFSTANGVEVFSYTWNLDKKGIVRDLRALKKAFPFEKLWSCYRGGESPCGECESCRRLARALQG